VITVGLDTSLPTTSVCVLREDGEVFATASPEPARLLGPARHSEELLPELAGRLADAGVGWEDVSELAVGVGPGTFTGLRIGISTARAIAQARGSMLRPVSSLEALAAGLASSTRSGERRLLLPLIDARRGQVFAALYRHTGAGADGGSTNGDLLQAVIEPAAIDPGELLAIVRRLDEAPLCAGDWALRFPADLRDAGAEQPPPDSGLHAVSALHVCMLSRGVEPVRPEAVQPVYLRLPDAEINRRLAEERRR